MSLSPQQLNWDQAIERLPQETGIRISQIRATYVPAPHTSPYPGEHLFINCNVSADFESLELVAVLAAFRSITLEILTGILAQECLDTAVSFCVTYVGHWVAPNSRLYRYSILRNAISDLHRGNPSTLVSNSYFLESSGVDLMSQIVAKVDANITKLDPRLWKLK